MMMLTARLAAAAVFLAGATECLAQPAVRVSRVGIVSPLAGTPEPPTVRAFRQGMRELGYVEGKDVVFEIRYAAGRSERLPELFAELINLKVDLLLTGSVLGALAAKKATTTVPIVFAGLGDALSSGIVPSLARPGGNITGATYGVAGADMAGKQLELLKEVVPGITLVAVLSNSAQPQSVETLREIHRAARTLKVAIDEFDAGNDATMGKAFAAISASGAQGLVVMANPYFTANRVKLVQLVAEKRLPAIYFYNLFPDVGGLMSYGGSTEDSYRRAASQVDRILKGAKPADLPVDQATKHELVVNIKTAKALGIAIPRSVLLRADRVIE